MISGGCAFDMKAAMLLTLRLRTIIKEVVDEA